MDGIKELKEMVGGRFLIKSLLLKTESKSRQTKNRKSFTLTLCYVKSKQQSKSEIESIDPESKSEQQNEECVSQQHGVGEQQARRQSVLVGALMPTHGPKVFVRALKNAYVLVFQK